MLKQKLTNTQALAIYWYDMIDKNEIKPSENCNALNSIEYNQTISDAIDNVEATDLSIQQEVEPHDLSYKPPDTEETFYQETLRNQFLSEINQQDVSDKIDYALSTNQIDEIDNVFTRALIEANELIKNQYTEHFQKEFTQVLLSNENEKSIPIYEIYKLQKHYGLPAFNPLKN